MATRPDPPSRPRAGSGARGLVPRDQTTRTMDSQGVLRNSNNTVVGQWQPGMKGVRPTKSTGDTAVVSEYVKQRKRAGTKGY